MITGGLNNLDPYSENSSAKEIVNNSIASGIKGVITGSLTAAIGAGSDMAVKNGSGEFASDYTFGFGEAVKAFFGWVNDAMVYIWE